MIGLEALTQPITKQSDQTRKLIFNNSFLLVSSVFEPFLGLRYAYRMECKVVH